MDDDRHGYWIVPHVLEPSSVGHMHTCNHCAKEYKKEVKGWWSIEVDGNWTSCQTCEKMYCEDCNEMIMEYNDTNYCNNTVCYKYDLENCNGCGAKTEMKWQCGMCNEIYCAECGDCIIQDDDGDIYCNNEDCFDRCVTDPPYRCDGGCGIIVGYDDECDRFCDFCERTVQWSEDFRGDECFFCEKPNTGYWLVGIEDAVCVECCKIWEYDSDTDSYIMR
jgi:hypothetical protein